MSDHADTIRETRAILASTPDLQAALDALVAENQQLFDRLRGWLMFVMEETGDPESSPYIAAKEELAALDGTPSAAQTLEDTQ